MQFKELWLVEATMQELYLEMISRSRFNNFDGKRIVEDLLAHRDLWLSVIMDSHAGLVHLRDLPDNRWNVSLMYIMAANEGKAQQIEKLADTWNADTVEVLSEEDSNDLLGGSDDERIVVVWWD
jgi:hypothetical protein